jgi:predicted metal-dependent HD superfamily phosphohydrolase
MYSDETLGLAQCSRPTTWTSSPRSSYYERTATHFKGEAKADLAHFLDADIAVLGLPPNAYAEYARQVRLESAHASDSQ